MTNEQVKELIKKLWSRDRASDQLEDDLTDMGVTVNNGRLGRVFGVPCDTVCDILECYGMSNDDAFEVYWEAYKKDDVNIILEVIK